jgi:hypothetical protein
MVVEHGDELLRRPANQIGNLSIAHLNDAQCTVCTLNNIDREKAAPNISRALRYDGRDCANSRV